VPTVSTVSILAFGAMRATSTPSTVSKPVTLTPKGMSRSSTP
jgi:3-oxoacyl-(acyl-carrier-protein) synthase